METLYSIGDYVDCKHVNQDWYAGRVIEKDAEFVKIRLDGINPNNDITLKHNSIRIAPFRRYTQSYTGHKKTYRDDPKLELDKLDEVSNLIEVFIQKDAMQFEAKKINEALRGRIFLFTDALLTKQPEKYQVEDIKAYLKYLCKYLGFGRFYLGKYQKSFPSFIEGRQNPTTLVTKPDVAYAHFIFELLFSLVTIFGERKRCFRLYEFINAEGNPDLELEVISIKVQDENITTGIYQNESYSTRSEEGMEDENNKQDNSGENETGKVTLDLGNCMIEKFAQIGGFKTLLNLIYVMDEGNSAEGKTTNVGFVNSKGEMDGERTKYGCPLPIVSKIIEVFGKIYKRLNEHSRLFYISELEKRVVQRIKTISDTEIKELELESLYEVLNLLEDILSFLEDKDVMEEFYKFRETQELNIYLRLIDSPSFEKKLKGINEIREFISRIEYTYQVNDDPQVQKKPVKYMTAEKFIEWVLENKLINLIYEKYGHIELIKKSIKIQKFIAEFADNFPQSLIDLIWNSFKDKHEEVIKAIYENIIELAPDLSFDAAQRMYSKFLTVKYENYDEDFVDLIGRFTQKCLRLVVMKTKDGEVKVNQAHIEGENQFFGVKLMFNLIMDESPLSDTLSYRVLGYLQEIISEFPAVQIFLEIVEQCFENLDKDISIYQSLLIMKEYLTTMQTIPSYQETCEKYFRLLEEKHNIINYLVRNIESYWQKVRQRIQAQKYALKSSSQPTEKNQNESFVGKFSHEKNIFERLDSLRYFTTHPYLTTTLSIDQVKQLWRIFVQEANFSFETSLFLQFFSQIYTVPKKGSILLVSLDNIKEVLLGILYNKEFLDIKDLTLEKFNCLEFYFLCANMKDEKITFSQVEESKNPQISSMNLITKDKNLIGLSYLWDCFIKCSDKDIVEKFTQLLVNIYTRLSPELKTEEVEVYKELIDNVMKSIERLLLVKDVQGIERYVFFLDKFFEKFENKKTLIYYKLNHAQNAVTSSPKIRVNASFLPYHLSKVLEFYLRDKVGYIKECLAANFEIESSEFDLVISGKAVFEKDMFREYQTFYTPNDSSIIMVKKKESEKPLTVKHLLSKNLQHVEVIFGIFSNINPEELKIVWNFVQKLSIQDDIKKIFQERTDYLNTLGGEHNLTDNNIYKVYYDLSIVKELSLTDEYYWKLKTIEHKKFKSEWATHFVNNEGVEWLMSLILKTDFANISNFLVIKTLLLLAKLLQFFLSLEEGTSVNEHFFSKVLDIFMYSSRYIGVLPKTNILFESGTIKDQAMMCQIFSNILQNSLEINPNLHLTFLEYPHLRELFIQVYIKLAHEEVNNYEGQEGFSEFLFKIFETVCASQNKEACSGLFKLIFEEIIFLALRNPEPAFIILRFVLDFLDKYNLKTDFNCDIEIFNTMIQFTDFIKSLQRSHNQTQEIKTEVCFSILERYLLGNPDKSDFFGQDQGLVKEILTEGIFKVPSFDGQDGPKYQSKDLKTAAFAMLALLGTTQKNFSTTVDFLLPIHQTGIWRSAKPTAWNLSANIVRRAHKYAGLLNLGCTCYMNSTLQQLFMIPTFQKYLLQLEDPLFKKENVEDNLLFQLKRLFYGLVHTDQEYFSPKKFCLAFKDLDGNPTSFLEQKDAFEFLSLNLDRIEEQLKGTKHADFIKAHFGGLFSNELICKGCPHYYEREEPFIALNLTVRNKKNIKESLESLIEGEILDGDNAYYCEQCKMKVKTVKRVSIKKLPSYLFLSLQRFTFNFDTLTRIKANDYCEFPFEINMLPYTQQYLNKMEKSRKNINDATHTNSRSMNSTFPNCEYTLKGVVIHMGTADSGHYYSIIRDINEGNNGKNSNVWLEFNDSKVSEFNIRDLPNIAFGEREGCPSFQSAYVLVYEKKELNDDLKQLGNLFADILKEINGHESKNEAQMEIERKVPQHIIDEQVCLKKVEEEVKRKNLKIFYQSNIFSTSYTNFIKNLVENYGGSIATMKEIDEDEENMSESQIEEEGDGTSKKESLKKLFIFLWTVYCSTILRLTDKKLQKSFFELICVILDQDTKCCNILLNYFTDPCFFNEIIFQCPHQEYRKFTINLIKKAFTLVYETECSKGQLLEVDSKRYPVGNAANFLSAAMNHLEDAKLYHRNSSEYFKMFLLLMKDDMVIQYLLSRKFLWRLAESFFSKCKLDEELLEAVVKPPRYYSSSVPIEFHEKTRDFPKKGKDKDFYKPSLTDLTNFFCLMWELLRHTRDPIRPHHESYDFCKVGANYSLNPLENKLFDLNRDQITRMFSSITINNKKARKAICRIVEFASYECAQNTRVCLNYICEELTGENSEDLFDEYFTLIKGLTKLEDSLQENRNKIMIETLINNMSGLSGPALKMCAEFLHKLIQNNSNIHEIMTENEEYCNKVIKALRQFCMRSSTSYASEPLSKPANFHVIQQLRQNLQSEIAFFQKVKENEIEDARGILFSESDDSVSLSLKREKPVEFYDRNAKKWIKGVVDNIYENMVKIRVVENTNSPQYEWVEDDYFGLRCGNGEIEEELHEEQSPGAEDDSNTHYSTDELSVHPNSSLSANSLD